MLLRGIIVFDHIMNIILKNMLLRVEWEAPAPIVFRLSPIQGPGSRFWPGHRIAWVNFFLKKSKRRRFSKKKSTGCNRVFDRVNPLGHTGFFFLYFFFNPARFQPLVGRVPGRPGPGSICQAEPGFKTMPAPFR